MTIHFDEYDSYAISTLAARLQADLVFVPGGCTG